MTLDGPTGPNKSTAASPPSSTRIYRPDIDGLRALAILSVVFYHSGLSRFTGGFTGVDIFFVISGYLIGGHIYAEAQAGVFSFLDFYARRARRILPAFFGVLAFCIFTALALLSPQETLWLSRSALAATLSASNVLFWHGSNYFDTHAGLNPLLMTWSLGVEEQFYAVIPLLLLLIVRVRRSLVLPTVLLLSALSFFFAWIELANHPAFVFYMLPTRAWELGIGVALAVVELNRGKKILAGLGAEIAAAAALVLMIASVVLLNAETPFPGPAALASVFGAALAISASSSAINGYLLSLPPLVFIGKISYSWYLWHWPLLSFLSIVHGGHPPRIQRFAVLTVSFAIAAASYFCIEQPLRRPRRTPGPLLLRYVLGIALAAAVCASLWLSHGLPQRFHALAAFTGTNAALQSDPCLTDTDSDRLALAPPCYDRSGAGPAVALWGDSHAASLAPGLRALAAWRGYSFIELAKSSCPPLVGVSHFVPRHPRLAAACLRYNEQALAQVESDERISIVILHASWAGYLHRDWQDGWIVSGFGSPGTEPSAKRAESIFAQSAADTIESLQSAGKQVIVIDDIPTFDFEPIWKLSSTQIRFRRILVHLLHVYGAGDEGSAPPHDAEAVALANRLLKSAADKAPRRFAPVDLRLSLCDSEDACTWRIRADLLYGDNNHLTPDGARYALRNFYLPPPRQTTAAPPQTGSR